MKEKKIRIGSLFSGIGGLDLGLEQSGVGKVAWQCEIDIHCRHVLRKHWPTTPIYPDITIMHSPPKVELVCGGPPCQDLSDAGTNHERKGLKGERSGLAKEMLRIIDETTPTWVVWENVDGAAWKNWVPELRRRLWRRQYTSVPIRLRAYDIGAPFKGARIFLVAKADSKGQSIGALHAKMAKLPKLVKSCWTDWGTPSPTALGVADGVRGRVGRLKRIGNAVVPGMAYVIGKFIKE